MNYNGLEYCEPEVFLLNESGIGVSEVAARNCYNSFEMSENPSVRDFLTSDDFTGIHEIENSELLKQLVWVNFHASVVEHTSLTYYIKGTSRGVLQEHARHRIQSLSVRSTRYTLSDILYAFIAGLDISEFQNRINFFLSHVELMDLFVTEDREYNKLQIVDMFTRLEMHRKNIGNERFIELCLSTENIKKLNEFCTPNILLKALKEGKTKRNAGDSFKHIVNDNWKTDIVCTFNLRSLQNYFKLRSSKAAWFQIQMLASAMIDCTPKKYLDLMIKEK